MLKSIVSLSLKIVSTTTLAKNNPENIEKVPLASNYFKSFLIPGINNNDIWAGNNKLESIG